jgi:Tryptophan-associated transmembrane protein (Trp_oprn_chp)
MFVAMAVTAGGALLVLATAGRPRWSADRVQMVGGGAPAATALALVALAGLGLLLLLGGVARSVIGLLLVLTGVAVVLVDIYTGQSGFFAYTPVTQQRLELQRSVWFWLTAAGGVVLAGGGLLVAIWGHRWPGTRRDYRAPADPSPARPDAWSALDRGEDPTL